MSRRSPLERLEDLATELFGRGTAISVDRDHGIDSVAIWSAKGVLIVRQPGKRTDAIRALTKRLSNDHSLSAGARCTEGHDGCCTSCGVSLTPCGACGGRGYHHAGCVESEAA